jgi:hypothetical protein
MTQSRVAPPVETFINAPVTSTGNYILKPNVPARIFRLSWEPESEFVIRPYPSRCHEDLTKFWPYRIMKNNVWYFGYWIIERYVAYWVGDPPTIFLINHDPTHSPYFDINQTPLGILYSSIERACKLGQGRPEWYLLREYRQGRGKLLSRPTKCCFIQGAVIKQNQNAYYKTGSIPGFNTNESAILMISPGASKKLKSMLDAVKSQTSEHELGTPEFFEDIFAYGDIVDLKYGKFIRFAYPQQAPTSYRSLQDAISQSQQSQLTKEYDIQILKEYDGLSANMEGEEYAKTILNKWLFWEDILYYPTYKEQAHMLARIMPPSAIVYAFANHPDWIPDDIKEKGEEELRGKYVPPPTTVQTFPNQPTVFPQPQSPFPTAPKIRKIEEPPEPHEVWKPGKPSYSTPSISTPTISQPFQPNEGKAASLINILENVEHEIASASGARSDTASSLGSTSAIERLKQLQQEQMEKLKKLREDLEKFKVKQQSSQVPTPTREELYDDEGSEE